MIVVNLSQILFVTIIVQYSEIRKGFLCRIKNKLNSSEEQLGAIRCGGCLKKRRTFTVMMHLIRLDSPPLPEPLPIRSALSSHEEKYWVEVNHYDIAND